MATNWHEFKDPEVETFLSALNVPPEPTTSPPLLSSFWNNSQSSMPALTSVWNRNEPIAAGMTAFIASQVTPQDKNTTLSQLPKPSTNTYPRNSPLSPSALNSTTAIPSPSPSTNTPTAATPQRNPTPRAPTTLPAATLPQHLASVSQAASSLLQFVSPASMSLPREPAPKYQEQFTLESFLAAHGHQRVQPDQDGIYPDGDANGRGPNPTDPQMAATMPSAAPTFLTATGDEETAHSNQSVSKLGTSPINYPVTDSSPLPLPLIPAPATPNALTPAVLTLLAAHRTRAQTALRTLTSPPSLSAACAALNALSHSLHAHGLALVEPPPCPPLPLPTAVPTAQLEHTLVQQAANRGLRAPALVFKILQSMPVRLIVTDMFWTLLATLFPQSMSQNASKNNASSHPPSDTVPENTSTSDSTSDASSAAVRGVLQHITQGNTPNSTTANNTSNPDLALNPNLNASVSPRESTTPRVACIAPDGAITYTAAPTPPHSPALAMSALGVLSALPLPESLHPLLLHTAPRMSSSFALLFLSLSPHSRDALIPIIADTLAHYTYLALAFAFPVAIPYLTTIAARTAIANAFSSLFTGIPSLFPPSAWLIPQIAQSHVATIAMIKADVAPTTTHYATALRTRLSEASADKSKNGSEKNREKDAVSEQAYTILNGLRAMVDETHLFNVKKESYLVTDAAINALMGAQTCKIFAQEEDYTINDSTGKRFSDNGGKSSPNGALMGMSKGLPGKGSSEEDTTEIIVNAPSQVQLHHHQWVPRSRFSGQSGLIWLFLALHAQDTLNHLSYGKFNRRNQALRVRKSENPDFSQSSSSTSLVPPRSRGTMTTTDTPPTEETRTMTVPTHTVTSPTTLTPPSYTEVRHAERDPQLRVQVHKAVVRDIAQQLHILRAETKKAQVAHHYAVVAASREAGDNSRALGDLVRKLGAARRAAKGNLTASTQAIIRAQEMRRSVGDDELTNGHVGAIVGDGEKTKSVKWGSNNEDGSTRVRKAGQGIMQNTRSSASSSGNNAGNSGNGGSGPSGNNTSSMGAINSMGLSIPATGYMPPAMRGNARARANEDDDSATGVIIRRIGTKAAEYSDVLHRYDNKKKM